MINKRRKTKDLDLFFGCCGLSLLKNNKLNILKLIGHCIMLTFLHKMSKAGLMSKILLLCPFDV